MVNCRIGNCTESSPSSPVVLELFTSEGCSSCPPADALLKQLADHFGKNVICVSEHIDYWDYLGWKDPFSLKEASKRQYSYAERLAGHRVYTPQIVINGQYQTIGSNKNEIIKLIRSCQQTKTTVKVDLSSRYDKDSLLARVEVVNLPSKISNRISVYLFLVENDLVSDVTAGENSGRRLLHYAVLRKIVPLGDISITRFEKRVHIAPDWNKDKLCLVALLQDDITGQIVEARELALK